LIGKILLTPAEEGTRGSALLRSEHCP
jgi:hypothetical protein